MVLRGEHLIAGLLAIGLGLMCSLGSFGGFSPSHAALAGTLAVPVLALLAIEIARGPARAVLLTGVIAGLGLATWWIVTLLCEV